MIQVCNKRHRVQIDVGSVIRAIFVNVDLELNLRLRKCPIVYLAQTSCHLYPDIAASRLTVAELCRSSLLRRSPVMAELPTVEICFILGLIKVIGALQVIKDHRFVIFSIVLDTCEEIILNSVDSDARLLY